MDTTQNQTAEGSTPSAPAPTEQKTSAPTATEHSPTLMGVLAYLGPLVLIPYILAKDVPFVKFHIKQGLVLFVIEAILWILMEVMLFWVLAPIVMVVNIGLLILSIIGIINVTQNKEAELPLLGKYASYFKF
jgi:uncharacterized membrane protein